MNIHEAAFCVVLAAVSSYLLYAGMYPQALFFGFMFFISLSVLIIHTVGNLIMAPLPRIYIPLSSVKEEISSEE